MVVVKSNSSYFDFFWYFTEAHCAEFDKDLSKRQCKSANPNLGLCFDLFTCDAGVSSFLQTAVSNETNNTLKLNECPHIRLHIVFWSGPFLSNRPLNRHVTCEGTVRTYTLNKHTQQSDQCRNHCPLRERSLSGPWEVLII